jgi:MFS transporter, ACS family, tartrate transporter
MADVPPLSSVTRKVTLRLVPFMMLLYLVNYIDRANVGYAAIKMNPELGLSTAMFGLGAGIFYVGYMLCEVPSNLLLHKLGARVWIARILVTWGIVSGLTAFIAGPNSFYLVRILLGVAEAGFYPGMILYLTYWLPRKNQVIALSIFQLGIPLSNIIAAPISLPIVAHHNILGLAGWRFMFLVEGVPAIILGVVTFFYLVNRPEQAKWLTPREKDLLSAALKSETEEVSQEGRHTATTALRNPRVYGLAAVYFGINFGLVVLVFFLPQIVASFKEQYGMNYSPFQMGVLTALPFLTAIAVQVLWGWHSRRTDEVVWHIAIPMFLGSISTAVALFVSSPVLAIIAISVTAACVLSAIPVFWQLPRAFLAGSAAAAGIGVINTIGVSSNFVGPYIMGWLRDATGNFRSGMLVIAAFLLMSGVLALVLRHKPNPAGDRQSSVQPHQAAAVSPAISRTKEK